MSILLPNQVIISDRDRMAENQMRINSQFPNPQTWVRDALDGQDILLGDRPDHLYEIEWDILQSHVLRGLSYLTISKTILREPESRVRGFAEDGCRKLVPSRAQVAQLRATDPEVIAQIDQDRTLIMTYLGELYRGVGSPFGDSADGLVRYFRAIGTNEVAHMALRKVQEDGSLQDVQVSRSLVDQTEDKPL